jgi:two-component system phosphate regulon sensor histidine kinase PhoR
MFVLDLRVILLAALLVFILVALLAVWLDRRIWRKPSSPAARAPADPFETRLRPLLNDVAHEFRTPLAVLLVHLEVLRSPTVPPETKQESIRLMQAETRRMSQMVSNILELGELETRGLPARRPVDLCALAAEVIAELQPFADEREIVLALDAAEGTFWAHGDSSRLKQVLMNLTDNALKYSRPHNRVEISLRRDTTRKKILCTVCDTGPGIAAEHLPLLTRRFYRAASDEISGSGLGLSVVAAILKLHDSALEIDSQTTGDVTGTRVRFELDMAQEMEEPR